MPVQGEGIVFSQAVSRGGVEIPKLTTRIKSADDGWFALEVLELPDLVVHTRSFEDIRETDRAAAGALMGQPPGEFDVDVEL